MQEFIVGCDSYFNLQIAMRMLPEVLWWCIESHKLQHHYNLCVGTVCIVYDFAFILCCLCSQEPEEIFEEDYYSVVVQTEEDIYQDLCYIDRQTKQVFVIFMLYC
jgi:hypothetical protein